MSGWWSTRSQREQLLLGVMIVLALLVVAWLGVARPLAKASLAAEARHDLAVRQHAETQQRVELTKALAARKAPALGAALPEFLRASANQAGFSNAAVEANGSNRAQVTIPSAKAPALLAWLDAIERQGVFAVEAGLRSNGDGTLSFDATMAARGE